MKKYILSIFFCTLMLAALSSCKQSADSGDSLLVASLHAGIDSNGASLELLPGRSKSFTVRAYADAESGRVSGSPLTITFKSDPDAVAAYNAAKGTSYEMCPGSAYEFISNSVLMPRYGASSSSAKIKITAVGLEEDVTYLLPITIDEVGGDGKWELASDATAYLVIKQAYISPEGGAGTKDAPYYLYSIADMYTMADKLEEDNMVYFRLMEDIDMQGAPWVPLNFAQPYKLKIDFDGNGHTISNFYCNTPNYASFFGVLYGRCYDVNFTNAVIECESASACGILGGYCGTSGLPGEARNCHVQGTVTNTAAVNGIGGLFGRINGATIVACSADCDVTGGRTYVGGLFGYDGGTPSTVSDCWTAGSVKASSRVGGITGGPITPGTKIYNCYSLSSVQGSFAVGGIGGHANQDQKAGTPEESTPNAVIDKCIAWNRSVHATSSDDSPHYSSGAVVGFTSVKNYLSNCYRRADLDFQECNSAQFNVLYDQENASPAAPLVIAVKGDYNYPYHGKVAPSGATLSSVARSLGWPEDIWDFSGAIPVHRDVKTDVPEESESTGQLPDFFEENEIYK